ncbi:MAG: alpha/beta fold hydrolase [Thermomicrobiales bacterium]
MAEWSDGELVVDGTAIHYYRMGDQTKPPVVLLHGFTDFGLCWLRLATDLADDYDIVMIDAVGHGRSGGPEHGFRARAVSDVLAVIGALGLERPALVGHSMGAATAAGVAAETSYRLRSIVLEDPPWRDTEPAPAASTAHGSRAPLGSPAWVEWMRSFQALSPDERRARAQQERPDWADIDRLYWADAKGQFNLAVLNRRSDVARPPWRETVQKITCPVLLLTADTERGAIVTPEAAQEAADLWHQGQVLYIGGAGHNIRREQYGPYRAAVKTFLRETEQA